MWREGQDDHSGIFRLPLTTRQVDDGQIVGDGGGVNSDYQHSTPEMFSITVMPHIATSPTPKPTI